MAILQLTAVLILWIPGLPNYVKEWGYAGIGLFLITALVAHIAHRDSLGIIFLLLVLFGILISSRYSAKVLF